MRVLRSLIAAVLLAASAATAEPTTRPAVAGHVLLIGLDGTRADAIRDHAGPAIRSLIDDGTSCWRTRAVVPSVTQVNWPSILTGCRPPTHGIDMKLTSEAQFAGLKVKVPTLLDLVAKGGGTAVGLPRRPCSRSSARPAARRSTACPSPRRSSTPPAGHDEPRPSAAGDGPAVPVETGGRFGRLAKDTPRDRGGPHFGRRRLILAAAGRDRLTRVDDSDRSFTCGPPRRLDRKDEQRTLATDPPDATSAPAACRPATATAIPTPRRATEVRAARIREASGDGRAIGRARIDRSQAGDAAVVREMFDRRLGKVQAAPSVKIAAGGPTTAR